MNRLVDLGPAIQPALAEHYREYRTVVLRSVYDSCRLRADVEAGTTKEERFAADLAQVVNKTAPKEYADPDASFPHSYPTRGMRELLKAVLTRLAGQRGEIASIIRLDTLYGGGTMSRFRPFTPRGPWFNPFRPCRNRSMGRKKGFTGRTHPFDS